MEKKIFAVLVGVFFVLMGSLAWAGGDDEQPPSKATAPSVVDEPSSAPEATGTPGKAYFDEQFGGLQRSVSELRKAVAEVKGDTSQTVSILGNVFEWTVPKGGTVSDFLAKIENGNLPTFMGANDISDPNKVAAGAHFVYPRTVEELEEAMRKGKPLYDAWLKKQPRNLRFDQVKVETMNIERLNIKVANIKEKLVIKNMEVDQLKVRLAEITERLRVKKVEVDELNVKVANFDKMNIDQLRIKDAKIKNLEIEKLRIKDALIDQLRIANLQIGNLKDLLAQAQLRCRQLENRPPKVVERAVPVTPGPVQFRQDNDCGEPYFPKSWEWQFIETVLKDGKVPVFWYLNQQPDGSLKVKVDYYDAESKKCYTVWCQRYLPSQQSALPAVRDAGFTADEGITVRDGGRYKTLLAGQVTNWLPGMVCLQ